MQENGLFGYPSRCYSATTSVGNSGAWCWETSEQSLWYHVERAQLVTKWGRITDMKYKLRAPGATLRSTDDLRTSLACLPFCHGNRHSWKCVPTEHPYIQHLKNRKWSTMPLPSRGGAGDENQLEICSTFQVLAVTVKSPNNTAQLKSACTIPGRRSTCCYCSFPVRKHSVSALEVSQSVSRSINRCFSASGFQAHSVIGWRWSDVWNYCLCVQFSSAVSVSKELL